MNKITIESIDRYFEREHPEKMTSETRLALRTGFYSAVIRGLIDSLDNDFMKQVITNMYGEPEEEEPLSNCCGAPPASTIVDEDAICSKCGEHAEFGSQE